MTIRAPWSEREIRLFLEEETGCPSLARVIAARIGRSKPAIQGMRRKHKRLRELGVRQHEIVLLLGVSDSFVQHHTLAEIRRRAKDPDVPVKPFLRRGRLYGQPGLIRPHKRKPGGST